LDSTSFDYGAVQGLMIMVMNLQVP